jgi:hypothetical protein
LLSSELAWAAETRLANLSSRGVVGTGDGADVLIAGFVISGNAPKDVLLRAVGPGLTKYGVQDALAHPRLEVYNSSGQVIASAEHWDAGLSAAFSQVGAAPLDATNVDAALRIALEPGLYSARVTGVGATSGTVLMEVYEMNAASQLVNISTRAKVEKGDGLLISGLVISGEGSRRVLLRASGPALTAYGVTGVLAHPVLSLFNVKGVKIASSDSWDSGGLAAEITDVSAAVGAAPFAAGSLDAAIATNLDAGIYSLQVSGLKNTVGIALLEVFDATGTGRHGDYAKEALGWTRPYFDARLGSDFFQSNPGAGDDRPLLFRPESKNAPGYYVRINPYEIGDQPGPDDNFWSDSGQVAYIPDDPANDPGLDRIQTFAYYNQVFAISPRRDWASGRPHPDPQTLDSNYTKLNGAPPMQPVDMVRNYAMQQNEALVLYRDGLLAVAGTQTSRAAKERPYPGFKFPANKVPRALAVTTSNEFAIVAVWDTDRGQGQLAVVALEGKYLPFHTWPYMAMPNQGSFSDFKLLGYVDVPMAKPDAVAAASNGLWLGPSSTDNKVLSQIDLSDGGKRALVYDGAWQGIVARGGYAIVSSREDNKVAIVDLTPLFAYVRDSYLKSGDSFAATVAARGSAPADFPQTFAMRPSIAPRVVWESTLAEPTAVLAGQKVDRWSVDRYKAYVASRNGVLHIIDTSPLMARYSYEVKGELKEIGQVAVGKNPVALCVARFSERGLPLIPNDKSGNQRSPDPLNNMLYVVCRGDREVDAVVTWHGDGRVYRRLRDNRLSDPVAVGVASRGNIVTVADFGGRKLVSFRIGTIVDSRNNKTYPPGGDGTYNYEYAGDLSFPGAPFLVNSTNVN